jgi:hypothetical protein
MLVAATPLISRSDWSIPVTAYQGMTKRFPQPLRWVWNNRQDDGCPSTPTSGPPKSAKRHRRSNAKVV